MNRLSLPALRVSLFAFLLPLPALAQFQNQDETPYVGWSSPTGPDHGEALVFEARPRLHFTPGWPDIKETLERGDNNLHRFELVFDPQVRMFTSSSVPVRMPGYRIYPSWSLLRVWYPSARAGKGVGDPRHYSSVTVDHGHYSNGQEGCPFLDAGGDAPEHGTPACDSAYADLDGMDLQARLNRRGGEFSTDFIRVKLKHLWVRDYADKRVRRAWEFTGSYTRLVDWWFGADVGGYTDADTRFYPMNQFGLEAAARWVRPWDGRLLLNFEETRAGVEAWFKPSRADQVTPWNVGLFANAFWANGLGLGVHYEAGQDAYNLRLVDPVHRVRLVVVLKTEPTQIELATAP